MTISPVSSRWKRSAPGLLLMLAAPLFAEVLPGATRLSSLFVLPIEICVWGGGALLIREVVRHWQLGWRNMMLLALALAVAEECLIQQTSLAPMVLQIKGQVYARAYGVNYVYLLWALVYEAVFVVFLPIHALELIYSERRRDGWVSRGGLVAVVILFLLGSYLAWFSWTQIARPKVFHVPAFNPPLFAVLTAVLVIGGFVYAALGSWRVRLSRPSVPSTPPSPWRAGLSGAIWAVLWYGLVLLGFGIAEFSAGDRCHRRLDTSHSDLVAHAVVGESALATSARLRDGVWGASWRDVGELRRLHRSGTTGFVFQDRYRSHRHRTAAPPGNAHQPRSG